MLNVKCLMSNVGKLILILFLFPSVSYAIEIPTYIGTEVVVTASRRLELKSLSPWATSVISERDVATSDVLTVPEILESVPGVDMISYGYLGDISSIRIRGSSSQQVLVLVDGQRINSPLFGGANLSTLMMDDVVRIEVVRTPLSVLYGSDAVGGVVNIITRTPSKMGNILFRSSSYNTQKFRWAYGDQNGLLSYFVSINQISSDGFRTNSSFSSFNNDVTLVWDPTNKARISLDSTFFNGDKRVPGSATFPSPNASQKDVRSLIGVAARLKVNDRFGLSGRIYQDYEKNAYNDPDLAAWGLATGYENLTYVRGIELQKNLIIGQNNIIGGIEARQDEGVSSSIGGSRSINNIAIYGQDTYGPVEFGIRGDMHSVSGSSLSPRMGVKQWINPAFAMSLTYATAFRTPNLNELFGYYPPSWAGGLPYAGNTSLQPERGQMVDLGMEFHPCPTIISQLTLFFGETSDLITTSWPLNAAGTAYSPVNIDRSTKQGIELEMEKKISEFSKVAFNGTYQKVVDNSTGLQLDYVPENKANLSVNIGEKDQWLNVAVRYVGERNYTDFLTASRMALPAYALLDVFAGKDFGALGFSFGVENLADTQYFEIADYPMPGRRVSFGLNYDIK
ncbi:MAG: TonB-dependent receptor [Candidatus Margulisbacteria bacterium]|nr:TonB-dependent receptor [Candidatus Margulisiibacteriota bacterium]